MTFRSKYGFHAIFGFLTILGCGLVIWFDRSRTQKIIETEVQRAVEGELTRRQKLIDDAAQERYQAILQAVEKVETIARQVTPIPHSGPDILLRPPCRKRRRSLTPACLSFSRSDGHVHNQ